MAPPPSKRKASEKSNDEERSKNSPEEGDGEGEALIEVGERYSAIIIRREVLTRRVAVAGGRPNHQRVDGEDIVIEM